MLNVERRGMENKNENIQIFQNPEFGNIRTMRDEKGEARRTQNINPQTLAITGVPADWVITKVVER